MLEMRLNDWEISNDHFIFYVDVCVYEYHAQNWFLKFQSIKKKCIKKPKNSQEKK